MLLLHVVVPGRVPGRALNSDPDAAVEHVMRRGPSTIRPDTSLETVVKSLRDGNVTKTLATDLEVRLIGTINIEDPEFKLVEQEDH